MERMRTGHEQGIDEMSRPDWRSLDLRLLSRFLIYFLALFFMACQHWIRESFGSPSIQQIIYHLSFSEGLISDTDTAFLVTFVTECLAGPVALACLIMLAERWFGDFAGARLQPRQNGSAWPFRLSRAMAAGLPVCILSVSLLVFALQFSVFSYAASRFGEDHFAQLYVDPADVKLKQGTLRNLILIYVESLESSYSDPDIFGRDLLTDLNRLPGLSFESYRPAPGTGWTIAAMVATQCGVPLQFVTRMGDTENGENLQSFLPGAVCLPDILERFGYRNVFLGGAALSFAGKGTFLASHHYDEAYGYIEWLRSDVQLSGNNEWGVYDDDLFRFARRKVVSLHENGTLFNLTLLTIDTHHPAGYYSTSCRRAGARRFEDIVGCVSRELVDFVAFVKDKGYLRDTNILIVGDHLAMPNPVYDRLKSNPQRRIFNKFISAAPLTGNTQEIIAFDLFPTLLEYVGVQIEGNRLGLGRSALFEAEATRSRRPRPEASEQILNFSRKYEALWTSDRARWPDPAAPRDATPVKIH